MINPSFKTHINKYAPKGAKSCTLDLEGVEVGINSDLYLSFI